MRIIYYFCTVKKSRATRSRCPKQRFLCLNLFENSKRIEWGRSNRPEVFALDYLTARNALSLCLKN